MKSQVRLKENIKLTLRKYADADAHARGEPYEVTHKEFVDGECVSEITHTYPDQQPAQKEE